LEFLARVIRPKEKIKLIQIKNEEIKLSLFENNMLLYLKDPKIFTKFLRCYKYI
jgi:hypothetical protein